MPMNVMRRMTVARWGSTCRCRLTRSLEDALRPAQQQGADMTLDEAVDYALNLLDDAQRPPTGFARSHTRQVTLMAALVATISGLDRATGLQPTVSDLAEWLHLRI